MPACLPPLQRGGDGYQRGRNRDEELKLCDTQLRSAENSPGEVNFNSAAEATNKNLLINRDMQD